MNCGLGGTWYSRFEQEGTKQATPSQITMAPMFGCAVNSMD